MSTTQKRETPATTVTTPLVRFSYAKVFEPSKDDESKDVWSVSILIPKKDKAGIAKINAGVKAAIELGKQNKFAGKKPTGLENYLRDGDVDRPDDEAYSGMLFFNAKSFKRPLVSDKNFNEILDPADFYSGCWGYANINFYPYNYKGRIGIGAGLNLILKKKDDTPLSGVNLNPADAFADVDLSEDEDEF